MSKFAEQLKGRVRTERYLIKEGERCSLDKADPSDVKAYDGDKKSAAKLHDGILEEMDRLQGLMYAGHQHRLLVVIQAMDTGGKDSTIRHVFKGINPQGVRVVSFKVPSKEESDHDYLWRVHKEVPEKGEITIFNRSHYEDILVPRVHKLIKDRQIDKRYAHINDFEKMLCDEGTTIVKFFLHISKDEQEKRIRERLKDPAKKWKFSKADIKERKLWPGYMKAYEEAMTRTSTERAPWYVVPANRKWYRNLIVASVLVNALAGLGMKYPR